MIKKTLTYLDYEGAEHTKDFYFSMSQTEFTLLNNKIPGGFDTYLKRIQEDHNEEKLIDLLTTFIIEGYGERTPDGLGFIKEDIQGRKLGKLFVCTEACDNLITELFEKEHNIGAFIIGMLPKSIQGKAEAEFKKVVDDASKDGDKIVSLPTTTE